MVIEEIIEENISKEIPEKQKLAEEWVYRNGSGSLRRAVEEGMKWREMYLHERAAMEIATMAEFIHSSRVLQGAALAEPDSPATTETCWYARTLRWRLRHLYGSQVDVTVSYLNIEEDTVREGMGLVITGLALNWIPKGRDVVVLVAEWKPKKNKWTVSNPC